MKKIYVVKLIFNNLRHLWTGVDMKFLVFIFFIGLHFKSIGQAGGNALYFKNGGANHDYFQSQSNHSINGSDPFTFEFWYKETISHNSYLPGLDDDQFRISTGGTRIYIFRPSGAAGSGQINTGYDIQLNVWTHYAFSFDGQNLIFYVNGSSVYTEDLGTGVNFSGGSIRIGWITNAGSCPDGLIDDLRLWTVAQAPTLGVLTGTEPNLEIYYKLDEGISCGNNTGVTTAVDAAGLGGNNNGILSHFDLSSSSCQSNWSVPAGVLPVELTDFSAQLVKGKTKLKWQTASELNNAGFHLQRSPDGKNWQDLAFLPGHGTTHEAQSYTYTDERPLPGLNYYRLRQVDYDGAFEYSKVVSVEMERDGSGISLYPNPATGTVTLALHTDYTGEASLKLYNLTGQQVKTQVLTLEGGAFRSEIGLDGLPAGVYLAEVTAGNERWRERLVVE